MVTTDFFICQDEELNHLSTRDKKLCQFIKKAGVIKRETIQDPFTGLIHIIISQQISNRARDAIWGRLFLRVAPFSPASILACNPDELRDSGISARKIKCIMTVAEAFESGKLSSEMLQFMEDQALVDKLIELPGIGSWSAEMLLIFTLKRRNVLSIKDLAIRRGLRMLHNLTRITPENFAYFKSLYDPYCSIASIYLWELASGKYPDYTDPAADLK